jgi:hypothetical protein
MRAVVLSSLLALSLVQIGSAQGRSRVLSADSGWTANGQRLLRGMTIDSKSTLASDAIGDLILECDQGTLYYKCTTSKCEKVEFCPKEPVKNAGVEIRPIGLRARLSALLTREPREPVLAAARAGGDPNDAVLLLDERGVHWGPALARVLEGKYCLRLEPVPSSATPPRSVTIDWDRALDSEGVGAAAGVQPGLYSLQKGTPAIGGACQADTDGTTAWVLIASGKEFPTLNATWKEQAAVAADLERSGATRSSVTAVRHTALAGLADSITR